MGLDLLKSRPMDAWARDPETLDGDVYCEVRMAGRLVAAGEYRQMPFQQAAEKAVLEYLNQAGIEKASSLLQAVCYWRNGAQFGPFAVDVQISATAQV